MEVVTFYYFAYGSNMLTTRLNSRCHGAVLVGRADADSTVIEFSKPSTDESGKATLRQADGGRTAGVLYEIPTEELRQLDFHEGVGSGYERRNAFPVRVVDGEQSIEAATYLATSRDSGLKPYDWYLALVIAGAQEHMLGDSYLAALRRVACMPDPVSNRRTRIDAIKALAAAGIGDYRNLLPQV